MQRATRDDGHCAFTATEWLQTCTDLVKWVATGVEPAGDAVLDATKVVAPDFGCRFIDRTGARQWHSVPAQLQALVKPPACPAN